MSEEACHARSVRCPDARDYNAFLRDCCKEHIRTMSRDVAAAFREVGVTFWLDYGTLRGAMSPYKGIIPWDKDADWGVLGTDWRKARIPLSRLQRQRRYHVIMKERYGSVKVRLSSLNRTNLDLFFWFERDDGTMYRKRYSTVDQYKGREFHRDMLYPLEEVEWEGMMLPAPTDPAAFADWRSGEWDPELRANHQGVVR